MNITRNLVVAVLMTIVTTLILGVIYPLVITAIAQAVFPEQANGQSIERNGKVIGSRIIAQGFSSAGYFRPRPSAAGMGVRRDQFGRHELRTDEQEAHRRREGQCRGGPQGESNCTHTCRPRDGVGLRLDPHISPAAADFQVARVARERGISEAAVRQVVEAHTEGRQFGFFGEPRVNVLELNLALDSLYPITKTRT
jgi:K+-transporting ATPase ATPase C chain